MGISVALIVVIGIVYYIMSKKMQKSMVLEYKIKKDAAKFR